MKFVPQQEKYDPTSFKGTQAQDDLPPQDHKEKARTSFKRKLMHLKKLLRPWSSGFRKPHSGGCRECLFRTMPNLDSMAVGGPSSSDAPRMRLMKCDGPRGCKHQWWWWNFFCFSSYTFFC